VRAAVVGPVGAGVLAPVVEILDVLALQGLDLGLDEGVELMRSDSATSCVRRRSAHGDLAVGLADTLELVDPRDVDEDAGLAEAQLHQWDEAVAACEELAFAAGLLEERDCLIQAGGALVFEFGGDHFAPPELMIRQSFSGRSIMSMW
jgi:hypothetical protein